MPDAALPASRAMPASPALYLGVALVAGALIALQIGIMRVFSVGSWAHFGSFVLSLAMLGFGLASAVMCVATGWFSRHWRSAAAFSLLLIGPLITLSHLAAQRIPFNAIFLISDSAQRWKLAGNFFLYLLPFLAGAFFIGIVFLKAERVFGRVYFADLTGSGVCGLATMLAAFVFPPTDILLFPILIWTLGGILWFVAVGQRSGIVATLAAAAISIAAYLVLPNLLGLSKLAVSDYKGIAYVQKFPDAARVYTASSPFGQVDVYTSSYLHFAPGLSDNAAFNLADFPKDAYLGLYVDGEGPSAVIKTLTGGQADYYRFLPMFYPYVLKAKPKTFVVQFGGGLSTNVALYGGGAVTVAESNPAVLDAFRSDPGLRRFTGDILSRPGLGVIPYDGRIFLKSTSERYDVIDLSLADSAGLSNPGGFAVVEKFAYTREAMAAYMRALADGGILSVTLWNKEEPPKSILKLYATIAEAARTLGGAKRDQSFFVASSYLSTTTVLYKRGGFTTEDIERLRAHTKAMSFDEIYAPGNVLDADKDIGGVLSDLKAQFEARDVPDELAKATDAAPTADKPDAPEGEAQALPPVKVARAAWSALLGGRWPALANNYVFDVRALTNDRPYFAAYVRPADLPGSLDHLEILQDEWGYLLLWATFALACTSALLLIAIPVCFGWRAIFSHTPGKLRVLLYFAGIGLGYMTAEVGFVPKFMLALSNPSVSTAVLITGMLVFSGIGSLVSERIMPVAGRVMPVIFIAIFALLAGYGLVLDTILDAIGALPYWQRLALCLALIFPPAFLMGFPMPVAMSTLSRLGKDSLFVWAWGVNGCFSVIATSLVPIVGSTFGLSYVLFVGGVAYLLALPAYYGVAAPVRAPLASH